MHEDEVDTDVSLVRRLLAAQFPQWADLPVEHFDSAGTVNAVYRLGSSMSVRLPRTEDGVEDIRLEQRWLPHLAPHLPAAVPVVLGAGVPDESYPWPWSVYDWIDGVNPMQGAVAAPEQLAAELAEFITALRRISPAGGPSTGRGLPLATQDTGTRAAIAALHGMIDTEAATAAWEAALRAPAWTGRPVWLHADLMPGNLLLDPNRGGLAAVIDFGCTGIGDPAIDLIPAWNLLPPQARPAYREALAPDDPTWHRGRGWALSMALIQLPYYHRTNPVIAANARHVITEVLADHRRAG
jgi:aminoglycoside phosphotransferase (APT) family kinase protein